VNVAIITQLDIERFVEMEYPRVVAAVRLITGDREGAPDAVQDAIVTLLESPPAEPIRNTAAWVTAAACNRVRDNRRHFDAETRALARKGVPAESAGDAVERLDTDVRAALMSLPKQQREVCVLHYLLDQSVDAIAEALGVSSGTVKTHLHRARTTLAARIQKEDHRG
jgi:RNA polymerase sigma-70 factor (ECF subfamily)